MKLKRILTVIITAAMLFSVPMSVAALGENLIGYDLYFNEDFTDAKRIHRRLNMDYWHLFSDRGVYGYADAKAIQTNEDDGYLVTSGVWTPDYVYVDYDMTLTLATDDDTDSEDDRFVSLVYVNDNMFANGVSDNRMFISFIYDFQEDCFRFAEGISRTDPEKQILAPVYMEICDDGMEFYTLGMTVERDRIRCFYGGELIFDFIDTESKYFIADKAESPLLFWQEGNFTRIKNLSVNRPGYLLDPSYNVGDAEGNGTVNLADVTAIMKYIAKWKDIGVNAYAADADRNGSINLSDITMLMRWIVD